MDFLPLYFDLKNKPCLLIGGGAVAARKAKLLARAGAVIDVIALNVNDELASLVDQTGGQVKIQEFQNTDLAGFTLIIAATDDMTLNRQVSEQAHRLAIPVNVVDNPELCSFILPSIIDRSPVIISVSSGGKSPILTRLLRARIESMVPAAYGNLAEFVGKYRDKVQAKIANMRVRRVFWENILQGPVAEMLLSGQKDSATHLLESLIERADVNTTLGEVYLVGAGPGDPDLLTFKALRLMQTADVILYDRLVAPEIVALARGDAEKVYVGKARANHSVVQDDINQMLIDYANQGKRVVRLKGGDPFIFGRGGEEIEGLAKQNIPFQVVPGITAASGCACYAGIPLTHRDYAQSVRFITGHLKNNTTELNWAEMIHKDETIVFYMGLYGLTEICSKLIEYGREQATPVALVQQGTTANQKVIIGTLSTMPGIVANIEVHAPTLIIVGEVVQLQEQLAWFSTES